MSRETARAASAASFGALLRGYRRAAGLTQEELAERAGLSARGLMYLEHGARQPYRDTVRRLAHALDLDAGARLRFERAPHGGAESASGAAMLAEDAPLVGRGHELALLERHLAGDVPPLLLLAGQPGIGKTRLLHEAAQSAGRGGWTVLTGGCQRRGGEDLYAPVLEALHNHLRGQGSAALRAALYGCAWLVRLLPELAGGPIAPLPAWTLPPAQERRLMFAAVGQYLANVAGPAGTLLLLDDLQWAGQDALDLLTALVRSSPGVSVRVLGAYRDTEAPPDAPLAVLASDLARAGLAGRHTVGPLAAEELRPLLDALLEAATPPAVRERLLQRTGGVPFFVLSCAQALRSGAAVQGQESAAGMAPWNVTQSVRERVAALAATTRALLGAAAVIGRVAPPALLRSVTGLPEQDVFVALDAACQAQLLAETERGYRFLHDVIREVIEADLGVARRMDLHRRVARALEGEPGRQDVAVLAYHYARGDAAEKAALYLEQAGDQAVARHAHESAAGYYRDVVELLDELGRARDAVRGREKLGGALRLAAGYDEAVAVLEQAAAAYRALGDREGQRRTLAQLGWVHALRGTPEAGFARIEPVLEELDAGSPSAALAALYMARARLYCASGRYPEELAAAERAAEIARVSGNNQMLGAAQAERGDVLVLLERLDEALQASCEAARLAEQAGDLAVLSTACRAMAGAYLNAGDFVQARAMADRALLAAEQLNNPEVIVLTRATRSMILAFSGEWDLARADNAVALALSRQIGASDATGYALFHDGSQSLRVGEWENAARSLEECAAMAARSGGLMQLHWAQGTLAERDLLLGQPERARARLLPFLDPPYPPGGVSMTMDVQVMLAWAYLDLGELARAGDILAHVMSHLRATGNRLGLVQTLWVQAMMSTRQGDLGAAEQALEEGLTLARGMPYPYFEARLLRVYGRLYAQQGEPALARERLEAALAIFRRLGARPDIEQAEHEAEALALLL